MTSTTEIQHTISVEVPAIMKRIMALVVFRLPKSPKAFREIPFSLVPAISVSSSTYILHTVVVSLSQRNISFIAFLLQSSDLIEWPKNLMICNNIR